MYIVIEKNSFDKEVIVRGIHANKKVAIGHSEHINDKEIQNSSEWSIVVTGTEFDRKYSKHAIA